MHVQLYYLAERLALTQRYQQIILKEGKIKKQHRKLQLFDIRLNLFNTDQRPSQNMYVYLFFPYEYI